MLRYAFRMFQMWFVFGLCVCGDGVCVGMVSEATRGSSDEAMSGIRFGCLQNVMSLQLILYSIY